MYNIKIQNWIISILTLFSAILLVSVKLAMDEFDFNRLNIQITSFATAFTVLVALIEAKLNAIRRSFTNNTDELKTTVLNKLGAVESEINALEYKVVPELWTNIERIKPEYLFRLTSFLVRRKQNSVNAIVRNIAIATTESELMDERGYLKHLRDRVENLGAASRVNAHISAACGQKTWNLKEIKDYWKENIKAAERNVEIRRIFLEEDGKLDLVVQQNAEQQKKAGINVRRLNEDSRDRLKGVEDLPSDLGFVVLEDSQIKEIVIHWGEENNRRGICIQERPDEYGVIECMKNVFETIWNESLHLE